MDTAIYSYDNHHIEKIEQIDFDIWSNKDILKMSALGGDSEGIVIPDLYDNNEPKKGGLIDARMGAPDHNSLCATCGQKTCDGHFAHIKLAEYVYHPSFLPHIHKLLSCVCIGCSKLLVHKNEDEIDNILKTKSQRERLAYIKSATKNITHCQKTNGGCGRPVPTIKIEQKKTSCTINIVLEYNLESTKDDEGNEVKNKPTIVLTPDIVHDILSRISNNDLRILGIDPDRSRPEDMIHKNFPVPPTQIRPSIVGGGGTSADDLTKKLADIVKANQRIVKNKENQTESNIKYNLDHIHLLQLHTAVYIQGECEMMAKASKGDRAFKSIEDRLKSKEGRVRGNLMSKRGDQNARTVITSDPTVGFNELGVPIKIAMNITFPEVVTPHNREHLQKLVDRGRDNYPGANFVFEASRMTGGAIVRPIDLRIRKTKIELHYGDIVERHLVDGDILLLNRQPTLHKQSMMGHRIKVINDPTLMTYRMSVAVCKPKCYWV